MEIQFFGANCFKLQSKHASIIVDDNLQELGKKSVTRDDDIQLCTNTSLVKSSAKGFIIDGPGEYEVKGVSISGIASRANIDESGKNSTIYVIHNDDITICITGHIFPELTDEQLEKIGLVDVLIVPVGGSGYTMDGIGAASVIKKIEPKIVIPSHYEMEGISYKVPQLPLDTFLSNMGIADPEKLTSVKIKPTELSDKLKVIVLEPK